MRTGKTVGMGFFYTLLAIAQQFMRVIFVFMLAIGARTLPVFCPSLWAAESKSAARVTVKSAEGKTMAFLHEPLLNEVSGMAAASDGSGHLWMLNDGSGGAVLYRVNMQGQLVQQFNIAKSINRDWEDLAIINWKHQSFLLIADVGDNGADRSTIELLVVAEPALRTPAQSVLKKSKTTSVATTASATTASVTTNSPEAKPIKAQLLPWKVQQYRYPQGARDCEAIAVDIQADKVYLLTKRTHPAQLFSASLSSLMTPALRKPQTVLLTLETELPGLLVPPAATKVSSFFQFLANWPTAMSIDVSQQRAVILTYGFLYFYQRQASQSWPQAFAQPFAVQILSQLPQAESVAFVGNDQVWVVSEGVGTPILSWQFPVR